MADYDALDEATLQKMAADAESYEERSAIRQAIRRKKKGRGENVGRARARGNSVYNRFAGSTAPPKQPTPKNFVVEGDSGSPAARPPSTGGRGSRGSTTPTQRETPTSPVPRPRTPTPPPTPEQPQDEEDEHVAPLREEEEVDIPPAQEEEAPPSPPPSPQPEAEPEEPDGGDKAPVAEIPGEEEEEEERKVEEEPEEEKPPSPEPPAEDVPVSPREEVEGRPSRKGREETDSGGARFGGVTLKSRRSDNTPTAKKSSEPQNEFLNLKLRQTSRDGGGGQRRSEQAEAKVDFGVKLRSAPKDKPPVSPPTHKRSSERRAEHGGPRTLRDYQELTSKPAASRGRAKREQEEEYEAPAMEPDELHKYLVAYVNSELNLHPHLPVKGSALFETCSNPANLCKLVNKSVPNTVDLRALTKISSSASESQRMEALKENMTLALESARAIGCRVDDDSIDNILNRHPQTIRNFLVDLIRARAVNLPGMDEEPSSTFSNMSALFEKLNISVGEETVDAGEEDQEEVTWHEDREKVRKALASPPPKTEEKETWREATPTKPASDTTELSYEERAAMRRAQREMRAKQSEESGGVELSYEERAAQRKAERERRRREREALAK